ncbi:MAG: lysyl-tRNA synthetase, class [Candidatus Poribacteria bacterium]|nr:lysyl-tRNA synthetase, class [Candidatus Poribacteria bacterium]
MEQISELTRQRILKLDELRKAGIDPYPRKYNVEDYSAELIQKFSEVNEFNEGQFPVKMAGRIMSIREHGKTAFLNIQDTTGNIQLYIRKDRIGDWSFDEVFKKLDIGDIIGVEGWVFRTRTGELTVLVEKIALLTKSLRPLPEKWHGLTDKEIRYRQRYTDLIVNPDVKKVFLTRTKIIQNIREFLNKRNFVEVETPVLQPIYGGAMARPFVTHHNALDMELYLRIADELYLKRLIVGGIDRVYEISKDFRNEGMDRDHNPEFTMLELYQAYADYNDMMVIAEEMVAYTAKEIYGTTVLNYQGDEIDFTPPWRRISMLDAIKDATGVDVKSASNEELLKIASERDPEIPKTTLRGKLIHFIFEEFVESNLIQPTFITDHPTEISPLAKKKTDDESLTERFEIFMGRLEVGNAFSELNDPIDQKERLLDQVKQREAGDDEAQVMDDDFIRALEYGMPPTGGLGIGIDRLVMLLTDMSSLRDVIFFPHMRPETED